MKNGETKEVFLIRHAESIKNLANCFGDPQAQFSLTAKGIEQTKQLAVVLGNVLNDYNKERTLIVSNQESRADQTAHSLKSQLNLPLITSAELNPIDSGDLSGISESEARCLYPEIMQKKEAYRKGIVDGYELRYPGGESVDHFQERIINAFFSVINNRVYDIFLYIGHQSTITAILSFFMNQAARNRFYHYIKLDLCGISKINVCVDGTGHIEYINKPVDMLRR
jgi:broad specificity phosphatase PhoE